MKIRLVLTGGTIDKRYNELNGELVLEDSHFSEMIKVSRTTCNIIVESLMMKDSLDMTDEDRKIVFSACEKSSEDNIIVAHGTDTAVETAKVLSELKNKTIIIFGAMRPYSFGNSDALFNFGTALSAVQLLTPGVYITMNGKIFDWNNVIKNKEKGRFQELS